jgi:hypothetical protein
LYSTICTTRFRFSLALRLKSLSSHHLCLYVIDSGTTRARKPRSLPAPCDMSFRLLLSDNPLSAPLVFNCTGKPYSVLRLPPTSSVVIKTIYSRSFVLSTSVMSATITCYLVPGNGVHHVTIEVRIIRKHSVRKIPSQRGWKVPGNLDMRVLFYNVQNFRKITNTIKIQDEANMQYTFPAMSVVPSVHPPLENMPPASPYCVLDNMLCGIHGLL